MVQCRKLPNTIVYGEVCGVLIKKDRSPDFRQDEIGILSGCII